MASEFPVKKTIGLTKQLAKDVAFAAVKHDIPETSLMREYVRQGVERDLKS